MVKNGGPRQLPTGLLLILIVVLSLGLTAASVSYQRLDRTLCRGLLGAGFPLPVVCDASGESPPSSWGRIDWADADSINLLGTVSDILLYGMLLWGAARLWKMGREWLSRRDDS